MDYQLLKTADAALALSDPQAAATALNAQTKVVVSDIATADARAILLLNGDWYKVKQLAAMTPSATVPVQAIAAADICADTLTLTTTLHTSNATQWGAIQRLCMGLVQAGALSQSSLDQWTAMRSQTVPVWPETITPGHIQTARSQP